MRYNPFFYTRPRQEEPDEEIEYNEVDQYGKRFRKVGHTIEYEPEINGVPQSVFLRSQKAQKVADGERWKREAEEHAARQTNRDCPWKEGRNQVKTSCEKDCPFYHDGCVFAAVLIEPTTDTKDKYCPIAGRCKERCAMYAHGCKLIELVKGMKPGKE